MSDTRRLRHGKGRAARHAQRAAPIPDSLRPIRPGLSGGRYHPLQERDLERVHQAALQILETIGLAKALPSCVELVCAAGGRQSAEGRVLFPRSLVEDTIASAARDFVLHAQDSHHDLDLSGNRVHFGTAGAAVHVVDPRTLEYRESTLADLYDAARLADTLDNIHFFQRPLVARDLTDPRELDLNTCYAAVAGTRKHVGSSWVLPAHLSESVQMLHWMAGGEQQWRRRPFVSMSCCFVVPPLRFAEDACACLETAVQLGMPVLLLAAGQAGATSPAPLAGALALQVAEVLAGLVYVNLLVPGHPAIFGSWPFISDLRTGAMSGGSGEQAVLMAACAQMAHYYRLPGGVAAGMADAKLPDAQSGFEKGYTTVLAAQAGANLIYEAAGMQASLLGFCLEGMLVDDDMLGAVMRTVRGIEVNDDTLSVEVIREVCLQGPEHFLGHEQTLRLMQSEYVYPALADRNSPKEWREQGSPELFDQAHQRMLEILARHYPDHIDDTLDAKIREALPIRLPRERMRPNGTD